jgi:hypothetical protein
MPQVAWWVIYGFWTYREIARIFAGDDLDCYIHIAAARVCDSTLSLSIYSSVLLLMTQALISRMLVPGMSIFVNASVRLLLLRA